MDCIIVDVDGTLADGRHRQHFLEEKPRNWKAFFAAAVDDPCIKYVKDLVNALSVSYLIYQTTGRPEQYRFDTINWFRKNWIMSNGLYMRKDGDYRQDIIVKLELLADIRKHGNCEPKFAIDDRPEVVKMWRDNGVPCLQVDDSAWWQMSKPTDDSVEWLEWMQRQHPGTPMFDKVADELKKLRAKTGYGEKGIEGRPVSCGICPFCGAKPWLEHGTMCGLRGVPWIDG